MGELEQIFTSMCHGGRQNIYKHKSEAVKCEMNFSVFLPPHSEGEKLPVLYYLSGLECTEKNFIQKSGFQQYAAKYKIIVVGPDTSPRGCNIEGEDEDWDFGTGAGFYVDATVDKWKEHYRMYSYVTKELPAVIEKNFPTNGKKSIFGHSMGGHGALICALKNPGKYLSASAFAPIANPVSCPWGKKCFSGYLGDDESAWKQYDATHLVKAYSGPPLDILIDQGTNDSFLEKELLPQNFETAASEAKNVNLKLRMQQIMLVTSRKQVEECQILISASIVPRQWHKGYDHSYYFISTFIGDHFAHHAKYLR